LIAVALEALLPGLYLLFYTMVTFTHALRSGSETRSGGGFAGLHDLACCLCDFDRRDILAFRSLAVPANSI
jgi:hypothetical protein